MMDRPKSWSQNAFYVIRPKRDKFASSGSDNLGSDERQDHHPKRLFHPGPGSFRDHRINWLPLDCGAQDVTFEITSGAPENPGFCFDAVLFTPL